MSTAKFEKLIDLIINEDQERAEQLFHEIVVEKSREIYEGLMSEDMTSSLLDEIEMEETNDMAMEDGEEEFTNDEIIDGDFDADGEEGEEEISFDDEEGEEEIGDEEGEGDLEDRVVDLEDKLDELMAEFEAKMGGEEEGEEEGEGEEESGVMESVALKKVATPKGGDDGQNSKSVVSKGPKVGGNGAEPVSFSQGDEKGRAAPSTQEVKGASGFKNVPGKDNFSDKGEAAPKPKHGDDGQNTKSVVATEGRRFTKSRI